MVPLRIHGLKPLTFLIASADPDLLGRVESIAAGFNARAEVVFSAPAALAALTRTDPPNLAILDTALPEMGTDQFLAAARSEGSPFPILLAGDHVSPEWIDRLAEGVIDDLVPRGAAGAYWEVRVARTLRVRRLEHELETLREAAMRDARHDRLTGALNREAILAALFQETDRVQRAGGTLSVLLFDVDDFGHWNSRLGVNTCDELLCQVATRTSRLLRSYDLMGRPGKDEFLVALPGCALANANMLAERIQLEVFASPFHVGNESVRLSACFGIAQSQGRSPVVVLREAEQALALARQNGPESIQCFGASSPEAAPVTFLSHNSGEELLAW
jgi:diguanylate cyclase (GGDEF)-like protein